MRSSVCLSPLLGGKIRAVWFAGGRGTSRVAQHSRRPFLGTCSRRAGWPGRPVQSSRAAMPLVWLLLHSPCRGLGVRLRGLGKGKAPPPACLEVQGLQRASKHPACLQRRLLPACPLPGLASRTNLNATTFGIRTPSVNE